MRQLLASDSAVFWLESNQIEWFYPLLQPYVHYVPVRLLDSEPDDSLRNVVNKVAQAEQHPEKVASIVREANSFAELHLSQLAFDCYSLQMLEETAIHCTRAEYSRLFHNSQNLQVVACPAESDFRTLLNTNLVEH